MSMRKVVVVLAAWALVAGLPPAASGCSCAGIENPRAALEAADGAFVGVLERIEGDPHEGATFHYRIEHPVKGVTGDMVVIPSSGGGAGCGLEDSVGERAAMFLQRRGGQWTSSLCSSIAPDRLLEAARPLPPADGRGSPAMVVGASVGRYRALLLDGDGRTLAYGLGPSPDAGHVIDIDVCPGNARVVEALSAGRSQSDWPILVVRAIDGFKVERVVSVGAVPGKVGRYPTVRSVRCRGPAAERLDVVVQDWDGAGNRSSVFRLDGEEWRVLWKGDDAEARLVGTDAAIAWGRSSTIDRIDLETGVRTPLQDPARPLLVVPGPRSVAVVTAAEDSARPGRLLLLDAASGALRAAHSFGPAEDLVDVAWVDERTVAVTRSHLGVLAFFDDRLRVVSTVEGWRTHRLLGAGGRVYGVEYDGGVLEAAPGQATARRLAGLPDGATYAMAVLPGGLAPVAPVQPSPEEERALGPVPTVAPVPMPPLVPAGASRPWGMGAAAALLLVAVMATARRSVRRSG